jgi:hypothetical protein
VKCRVVFQDLFSFPSRVEDNWQVLTELYSELNLPPIQRRLTTNFAYDIPRMPERSGPMTRADKEQALNLFSVGMRNRYGYRRHGESVFSYLDKSANAPVVAARDLLQGWFEHLPAESKADIRGRFQSKLERQHQGAFWELYLHEFLLKLRFAAMPHPPVPNTSTHPDFFVRGSGQDGAYVEAALAGLPSEEEEKATARKNEVYDLINSIERPIFFLHLNANGSPKEPPKTKQLRMKLQQWLGGLDPDLPSPHYMDESLAPRFEGDSDGWSVTFRAIPKSPRYRGNLDVRPIGILPPETRWLKTSEELLDALKVKGSWYGIPDLPLVIAVNHVGLHCDRGDVLAALYGREKYVYEQRGPEMEQTNSYREADGFWRGRSGPRNQHVAGVLVGYHLNTWCLGTCSLDLYLNPWAHRKLLPLQWRVTHSHVDLQTGEIVWNEGETAGQILKIPDPWPLAWETQPPSK